MNRPHPRRPTLAAGLASLTLAAALGLTSVEAAGGSTPATAPAVITPTTTMPATTAPTVVVPPPTTTTAPPVTSPEPIVPPAPSEPAIGTEAPGTTLVAEPPLATNQEGPSDDQGVGRVVLSDGHVDIGPRFVDGAFTVQVRDDSGPTDVWRNTADVVIWAVPASELAVPADPAFAFLGPAGSPSWVLPQTQVPGVIWPGWNTQAESVKAQIPGSVDWTLRGVQGPGTFHLFLSGNFGEPDILFDSTRSFPQTLPIAHNTHTHGNWAFSQPGTYKLDVEFSATTAGGSPVRDRRTISIAVGDVDPTTAFPAPGAPSTGSPDPSAPGGSSGGSATGPAGGGSPTGSGGSSSSTGGGSGPKGGSGASGASGAQLPNAGAGSTVALAALGVASIMGGTALVRRSARRGRRVATAV